MYFVLHIPYYKLSTIYKMSNLLSFKLQLVGLEPQNFPVGQRDVQIHILAGLDLLAHAGHLLVDFEEILSEPEPVPVVSAPAREKVIWADVVLRDGRLRSPVDSELVQPVYERVGISDKHVLPKSCRVVLFEEGSDYLAISQLDPNEQV